MFMIRTVLFLIGFWLFQIAVLPPLLVVEVLRLARQRRAAQRIAVDVSRWWARWSLWMAGARVHVSGASGLSDQQSALIVSNHMGEFDIPILLAHCGRPIAFISKAELARVPLVGRWMIHLGCIFLDRSDPRQGRVVSEQTVEALRSGSTLVIFPEGTRSDGPSVNRFKTGAARIALEAGVPVVPVSLKDTYKLKPREQREITPAQVELIIHPAISVELFEKAGARKLNRRIRETILAPLPPEYDAVKRREDEVAGNPPVAETT